MRRTFTNTIAIACATFAAMQLVDKQYLPAVVLGIFGAAAYFARHMFPVPGED